MPIDPQSASMSPRKLATLAMAGRQAHERDSWISRNAYYYGLDRLYMQFLVPEGVRVLDLGCGTGDLLAALRPSRGVGVDFSKEMIAVARNKYPNLEFVAGDVEDAETIAGLSGPFDVIVLSDTIGALDDCQITLSHLHRLCHSDTRLVVAYYSRMWEPLLKVAERLGLKMPQMTQNWLSTEDIANLLSLSDFEVVKREWRQLIPRRMLGLGTLVNRYVAPMAIIRRACLRNYVIARPRAAREPRASVSIVVPCRNERGNIEPVVLRTPRFCEDIEIIFVEGHSLDGTREEIQRVIKAYPKLDLKLITQPGKGKGDAVRAGFAQARGDVLMILDADLTVPPEALPRFYDALVSGKGEFINGSRLVYPMESQAMRFLNLVANQAFSWLFTWLLNQRFTDTLCGTKALRKRHYEMIARNRRYFGDFDPFGDFDLIFGASKLNLKILEIPIRYSSRVYGETQISRFSHGWLLLRMVVFAFRKLKAF